MKTDLRSVVLISAGLDSTVNLFAARERGEVALGLTFDYGQKAAAAEIRCAGRLCADLKIPHQVVALPFFNSFPSSLIAAGESVPTGAAVNIDNLASSRASAKSVWVPNRNGIFLNIAAGFAESIKAQIVVPGFNAEEAATFPDNSEGFMGALDASFNFSTSNHVRVECYTAKMNKTEIVKLGQSLSVPFENIWPCYLSGPKWCRQCESCQRSLRALSAGGVKL